MSTDIQTLNGSEPTQNPFDKPPARSRGSDALQYQQSRSSDETKGQIVMAKRFPRDRYEAYERIKSDCERYSLAQQATYSYPRGGKMVSGPSIRLAEALAQAWGNLDFGTREIERRDGESLMEAYCWDLESNTRKTMTFTVPHRKKSSGEIRDLSTPRDIYEHTANLGARRMRSCILAIIPGDIVDQAVEICERTVQNGGSEHIEDRTRKMVVAFKKEGIPKDALEHWLGHPLDTIRRDEFSELTGIYQAIKDNYSARDDFFGDYFGSSEYSAKHEGPPADKPSINDAIGGQTQSQSPPPQAPKGAPQAQQWSGEQAQQEQTPDAEEQWQKQRRRLGQLLRHAPGLDSEQARDSVEEGVAAHFEAESVEQVDADNFQVIVDKIAGVSGEDRTEAVVEFVRDHTGEILETEADGPWADLEGAHAEVVELAREVALDKQVGQFIDAIVAQSNREAFRDLPEQAAHQWADWLKERSTEAPSGSPAGTKPERLEAMLNL